MSKYYSENYLFNILLLIWCISIPFKNAVYQISTGLIVLFFLVYIVKYKDYIYFKELALRFKDLILAFFLIILSMTISNFINNVSKTDAWRTELMFIIRYAFPFIIFIYFYSKKFFKKNSLLLFIFISLVIQSIDGVYQSILGYDFFKNNIGSLSAGLTGVTFNRNTFGLLMGLGSLISFILLIKKQKLDIKAFFLFLLFVLFIYSGLFSYSRSSWLALFSCFIIYLIINFKSFRIKHLIYFSFTLLLIISMFFNVDSLLNRLDLLLAGASSNRDLLWLKAIELIQEKPIFGWGVDTWQLYGLRSYPGIHNSLLEISFFTGLFGLVSFLIFFFLILKTIFVNREWNLLLIVNYLFVVSQFDHNIFKSKIFLSVVVIFMFYTYLYRIDKYKKT